MEMAYKSYTHSCKQNKGRWVGRGVEICPECGEKGKFDGWDLSVVEHMASYQRRFRIRALGPHRSLADELFKGRMKACDRCDGRGVVGINNDEDHEICPKCEFRRQLFDGTPEEFESIRQKIIAVFPTADPAVPMPKKPESSQPAKGYVGGGFFRPADNSLQGFKDFVIGFSKAINPDIKDDPSSISDEKWEESWKKAMSKKGSKKKD
jgi:RNA polymerase subunit RPABC4/transcription elongation factor Spt4